MQKRSETLESYFQQHTKSEMAETTTTPYKAKQKGKKSGHDIVSSINSADAPDYNSDQSKIPHFEDQSEEIEPIIWSGPVNVLADVFFQFMNEITFNGKPLVLSPLDKVARTLSKTFCDEEGNKFSKATLKTDMQRSKSDKRPKPGSKEKIDIKKIIGD
jgi:hypothetical protein